jgi:hypothetical protein
MTRYKTNRKVFYMFAGSTGGTTLISIAAALMMTSLMPEPLATPDTVGVYEHSPRPHFRLSPIPAGADWTRS